MFLCVGKLDMNCDENTLKVLLEAASRAQVPTAVSGATAVSWIAGNCNFGDILKDGKKILHP
jgi:hypothetical protein